MVKILSRRKFGALLGTCLGGMTLAACTSVKDSNGNTIVTISVAKVDAYAQAVLNGASSLVSSPTIVKILGQTNVAMIQKYADDLTALLTKFDDSVNGALTITWSDKTAVSIAQSILTDAQNILAVVQDTISAAQLADIPSSVGDIISAVRTVVSLLQVLLTATVGVENAPARAIVVPTMTEAQALGILHVAVPK